MVVNIKCIFDWNSQWAWVCFMYDIEPYMIKISEISPVEQDSVDFFSLGIYMLKSMQSILFHFKHNWYLLW